MEWTIACNAQSPLVSPSLLVPSSFLHTVDSKVECVGHPLCFLKVPVSLPGLMD